MKVIHKQKTISDSHYEYPVVVVSILLYLNEKMDNQTKKMDSNNTTIQILLWYISLLKLSIRRTVLGHKLPDQTLTSRCSADIQACI